MQSNTLVRKAGSDLQVTRPAISKNSSSNISVAEKQQEIQDPSNKNPKNHKSQQPDVKIIKEELIEDPFKKRVNPNFQASQVPTFDWTAAENDEE